MQKTGFLVATTAIGLVLGLTQAQGAGFKINETRTTANATAGAAAIGGDVTAMWNNPATMTSLDGHHFAFNGAFIIPDTKFKKGSGTNVATGNNGGNGGEFAFVPAVYGMWSVQDNMKIGLALTVPFGLATKYDKTWVGRFHSVHSELKTLNINPNVAYKINDMWSVGLGVSFQYADATLEKKINNASFGAAGEANSKVTGDDWGAGFNVGVLFEPMKGTRLGLAYRSKITHGLRGKIENTGLATANAAFLTALNLSNGTTKVSGDLTTPESLDFSVSQELGEAWTLLGSVVWTRWNRFNELGFKRQDNVAVNGGNVGPVERQGWKNVFMFSLGADWKFAKDWVAHFGVAYDQSPVSKQHRSPRLPGNDRTWLATGLDWSVTDWAKVGLSYTYIFVKDAKIDITNGVNPFVPGSGNRLQGKFESDIHIIGINANFKF
ncbi:MAG: transporter [Alphaproteobacteria bacterium]|nr:transporter [Alphaproteobacteria bacterium]NCQ67010.1 transporter [Alphaproteobacteria bacterium]NCT07607.1 transporter [Alphaproteobacteria bacterium]